jgi:hypothetical protein
MLLRVAHKENPRPLLLSDTHQPMGIPDRQKPRLVHEENATGHRALQRPVREQLLHCLGRPRYLPAQDFASLRPARGPSSVPS